MRIELLYFDGCPHHEAMLDRLHELLRREGIEADVLLRDVRTDRQADALRFLGSPSLRVQGVDVETAAAERDDYGLKCRLYRTPDGLQGLPPDDWILDAIRRHAGTQQP